MDAPSKVKLVVSDFHLGKGRYFQDGTQNLLEDFVYDGEFSEFLRFYRTGIYLQMGVELILNGDILNLLQIDSWGIHTHLMTERSVVYALRKIIKGHPMFFEALQKFAATPLHSIAYVCGNHDMGMLWPKAREVFSKSVGAPVRFYNVAYEFDGIHVEHGQQYEQFAKSDLERPFISRGLPEPVLNLPWGSQFVAVCLPKIKKDRPYVDKVRPTSVLIRWILIHDFLWGCKTIWNIIKFILETLFIRERYQIKLNLSDTLKLLKEISLYPNYDKIAFKLLESKEHINTVIFGHTHIPRYRQWREGKQYFNEGTWNETTNLGLDDYGKQIRLCYAFIEYPPAEEIGPPKVKLKFWQGGWRPEIDASL